MIWVLKITYPPCVFTLLEYTSHSPPLQVFDNYTANLTFNDKHVQLNFFDTAGALLLCL